MKINTEINLVDGRYRVQISVFDLTAVEEELFRSHGNEIVNTGGTFSGSLTKPGAGAPTSVSFELPEEQRMLPSQFPVVQIFDLDDDADSDVKAKIYANEISNRISTAKTNLLNKNSHYIGQTVTTI